MADNIVSDGGSFRIHLIIKIQQTIWQLLSEIYRVATGSILP